MAAQRWDSAAVVLKETQIQGFVLNQRWSSKRTLSHVYSF